MRRMNSKAQKPGSFINRFDAKVLFRIVESLFDVHLTFLLLDFKVELGQNDNNLIGLRITNIKDIVNRL